MIELSFPNGMLIEYIPYVLVTSLRIIRITSRDITQCHPSEDVQERLEIICERMHLTRVLE